mgnify:CR=1 FL=1
MPNIPIGKIKVQSKKEQAARHITGLQNPANKCSVQEPEIRRWIREEIRSQAMEAFDERLAQLDIIGEQIKRLDNLKQEIQAINNALSDRIGEEIASQLQEKVIPLIHDAVDEIVDRVERGPLLASAKQAQLAPSFLGETKDLGNVTLHVKKDLIDA